MKKIWSWIKSLFTKENVGKIWATLLSASKSAIAEMISNKEVQDKAVELAKSLMSEELTSEEKAEEFDSQMKKWLVSIGKTVGTSTLATIRELAVSACKVEEEEEEK